MAIDTVTLNIIHNALTNIASEMALVMLKTSYSTIFNEGLDFTTVLLDRHGDLIAEKNYTPSMMGAIPHTVKWAVEEKGIEHLPPRRRPRPQRLLPRRLPSPRAHDDAADVRWRSALRVRRKHRTCGRDRRQSSRDPSPPTRPTSIRKGCASHR